MLQSSGHLATERPLASYTFQIMTMTLIYLPMNLPMECLTSPNILEQSLPVIEFDKKSNSISLVIVKLFKTRNELFGTQDTNTLLFINKLFFLYKRLTISMIFNNQIVYCSCKPFYQLFINILHHLVNNNK